MTTIKYASREQHKVVSTKISSNVCINFNLHGIANYKNNSSKLFDWTIQDLIQTIKA